MSKEEKLYDFYILFQHNDGHLVWWKITKPSKKEALAEWMRTKQFHESYSQKGDPDYFEWPKIEGICLVYKPGDEKYVDPDGEKDIESYDSYDQFERMTGASSL